MRITAPSIAVAADIDFVQFLPRHWGIQFFVSNDLTSIDSCEVLLVNSRTQVTAIEAERLQCQLVCTVTSGTNHIDVEGVEKLGIKVVSARGANAQAVSDYVTWAVAYWLEQRRQHLSDQQLGIVGYGAVGSLVAKSPLANAARNVRWCDPYVAGNVDSLQSICSASSIVTLHCDLHNKSDYPTVDLLGAQHLAAMPTPSLLVNAARGEVLARHAGSKAAVDFGVDLIVDTFRNEPMVESTDIQQALIATPHIAGHSTAARYRAMAMVVHAIADWCDEQLEFPSLPSLQGLTASQFKPELPVAIANTAYEDFCNYGMPTRAITHALGLEAVATDLSRRYQQKKSLSEFAQARTTYQSRYELQDYVFDNKQVNADCAQILQNWGLGA